MDMDARQKSIENGSRYRSKSYQVRNIVKCHSVNYYVYYFEVFVYFSKNDFVFFFFKKI